MKVTIRPGTFETNSSSTHSIVIKKDCDERYNEEEIRHRIWNIDSDGGYEISDRCGEDYRFGWEFKILDTFIKKWKYAFVSYQNNEIIKEELKELLIKYVREITYVYGDDEEIGYIDHQSKEMLDDFLKDNDVSLEDFLTMKKYIVIIDNDNDSMIYTLCRNGFIKKDNFEKNGTWSDYE